MLLAILFIFFKLFMLVCAVTNALIAYKQVRNHIRVRKPMKLGDASLLVKTIGSFLIVFWYTRHSWLGGLGFCLLMVGFFLEYRSDPAGAKAFWSQPAFPVKRAKTKISR